MPPPAPHAPAPAAPAPIIPTETPESVVAYDEQIIEGKVKPWVELTKSFAVASVIDQVRIIVIDGPGVSC